VEFCLREAYCCIEWVFTCSPVTFFVLKKLRLQWKIEVLEFTLSHFIFILILYAVYNLVSFYLALRIDMSHAQPHINGEVHVCLQLFWVHNKVSRPPCPVSGHSTHVACSTIPAGCSGSLHAVWCSWTQVWQV
jgi:hypothetical protein